MTSNRKRWPSATTLLKSIMQGKTLVRSLFNEELRSHEISGVVLDIGGGRNQDYLGYLVKKDVKKILTTDIGHGDESVLRIDFEKDPLPFPSETVDTVIAFNILEHIYNHNFLVSEIKRVTRKGGKLLGFVPFLVNYHPDPHDYFRYTKEALKKILVEAGYQNVVVTETGGGPFAVNYNNIILSIPILFRLFVFPVYYVVDRLFIWIRPKSKNRYPLGYMFSATK